MMVDFVLVYGTLMRDQPAHRHFGLHRHAHWLGNEMLRGWLYDLGHYPGFRPGWGQVHAELHALTTPGLLAALDAYEGFDPARPDRSEYVRRRWPCRHGRGYAWLYLYNGSVHGKPRCAGRWPPERMVNGAPYARDGSAPEGRWSRGAVVQRSHVLHS